MNIQKKGHFARARGAGATAATLAAALVFGGATDAAAEKIRLTVAALNANFAQYFAAEDKGYFKEEGLDVEIAVVGGVMATSALIAGGIHYSGSPSSAMTAILRGAPIKVILVGQSRPIYEMWSFDPAVKTFQDLKGKIVPVTQRGGTEEIAVRMILKAKNLPPDFLGFMPMSESRVKIAALVSGAQKHALLSRTEKAELKRAGLLDQGRMIVNVARDVQLQTGGIAVNDAELMTNRDRAKRVLRAVWKGTTYMETQRDGVIEIMRRRLPDLPAEGLTRDVDVAIDDLDKDGTLPPDVAARELAVRGEILDLTADKIPPAAKVYDFSLIEEVKRELRAANWKPTR